MTLENLERLSLKKGTCNNPNCRLNGIVEVTTGFCADCYAVLDYEKDKAMQKAAEAVMKTQKKLSEKESSDRRRAGEWFCDSCNVSKPVKGLNDDLVCGNCQKKLNKAQFKEEDKFEKKRYKILRRSNIA